MKNDKLNYGIILFGDIKIEGTVSWWVFSSNNNTVNLIIDGVEYKTDSRNVLLMHRD